MGETLTAWDYTDFDGTLEDLTKYMDAWWGEEMRPFVKEYRDLVWDASIGEAERKYGELLETCDEGTECRAAIMISMREEVIEIWRLKIVEIK